MNEKLKDKVVAIELAGNNILLVNDNDNDNFKNELICLGFEKVEPYYSISIPTHGVVGNGRRDGTARAQGASARQ